ncbi:MAG: hypothetical protein Q4D34_02350 [Eggerthellaceae bacterium]|nr:hypothetical protein [Eggerthellaceae bacterium]
MLEFFNNLRIRYSEFMVGRYGMDKLNWALLVAAIVVHVIYRIFGFFVIRVICWVLLIVMIVRFISRDHGSRTKENIWWEGKSKEITAAIASADRSWRDRDTTLYFNCEGCKTKLSVPRGKGKVRVVCPNCGQEMFKNT